MILNDCQEAGEQGEKMSSIFDPCVHAVPDSLHGGPGADGESDGVLPEYS